MWLLFDVLMPPVTTLELLCLELISPLNYTELNASQVIRCPYIIGPNMSRYGIICTYYPDLPVMEIHLLHSPPPDCSAVLNLK